MSSCLVQSVFAFGMKCTEVDNGKVKVKKVK